MSIPKEKIINLINSIRRQVELSQDTKGTGYRIDQIEGLIQIDALESVLKLGK